MIFDRIYIEISNICNLQCNFCPEVLRPKKMMSIENFENILTKIKPYTKAVTLHVMGEPLAHPNFSSFITILEKVQIPLILTTNGTLLNRHEELLIKSSVIKQINFSLHSFFNNFPNKDITSYLKSIVHFSQSFTSTHPESFINYRLWNLQEQESHLELQNEKILSQLANYFSLGAIPPLVDVKKQKSFRLERHIKLHFDTEFEWPQLNSNSPSTHGFCYGLKNQLAILTEGTVVPCCLDKEAVINLGSIFDSDLNSLLMSDRAQNIINGFKKGVATEPLCLKCQFKTRFNKPFSAGSKPLSQLVTDEYS